MPVLNFFFKILTVLMWLSPAASFSAMSFLIGKFGIASLINMDKKKAMLAITCGVLLAGLIVGSLSFGLLKGIIG